jgi:dTDP-4-dehydrorhamnose reductase
LRVAILGSTGMLGSTISKFLTTDQIEVWEFNRAGKSVVKGNNVRILDVTSEESVSDFLKESSFDCAINGIGLIKQRIKEESEEHTNLAYRVNSDFQAILNAYSQNTSTPVIQIGTDCVYSGLEGSYSEDSEFDCSDLYGLSKVSGEQESKSMMTIRCSIIGHEVKSSFSLMDWFLSQPVSTSVNGYTNHIWNGVTTLTFARVIHGIISKNTYSPGTIHLVPKDQVSKFELLQILAEVFERKDIEINEFEAEIGVNRTLATNFPHKNEQLWLNAGYTEVPSIVELIQEYAEWSS